MKTDITEAFQPTMTHTIGVFGIATHNNINRLAVCTSMMLSIHLFYICVCWNLLK